ncbi:MAG: YkgJ family cysteine cluster protein [Cyanobacteria bacterium]|nr:YkgJ family cysteine cluster protein [Cyanobacteriota bacterium]
MKFFWLNFHLPYACRHSGMCCTSGWPIPVERARVAAIDDRIAANVIPLQVEPWLTTGANLPEDVEGTLALGDNGHCVFFEAGRPGCAIHDAKPASCAHFPFVCLIDQRGIHVTLSHFCPTSTSLLFEHTGPIEVVEGPSPLPDLEMLEGLDARDALPPVMPGAGERLMSFDELDAWQHDRIAHASIGELQADDIAAFNRARAAVPSPLSWPAAPDQLESIWFAQVAPAWRDFEEVLTRYAAAKAFASWSLYLGGGIDAAERTARIAHAVVRVECARQCRAAGRPLDRELLMNAIEQSDLLLVHYADPEALATSPSTDRRRD